MFVGSGQEPLAGAVDEARIELKHRGVTKAKLVHRAGTEILDQHIRVGDEPADQREPGRSFHINAEAALVPVKGAEEADGRTRQATRVVTARGGLDLHHVGPEVSQHHATARSHDHVTEFYDAETGQGGRQWRFGGGR